VAPGGAPEYITADAAQPGSGTNPASAWNISKDLTTLPADRGLVPGALGPKCKEAFFDHVLSKSGLEGELSSAETKQFKAAFLAKAADLKCEVGGFREAALEQMQLAKPVMVDALAKYINGLDLGFTVAASDWTTEHFQARLGRSQEPPIGARRGSSPRSVQAEPLPASFDSRSKWPKCAEVIGKIHDQGHCGSCWVFGALGPLDSRLCIATGGNFSGSAAVLSRGFGASCASNYDGCLGGWEYWVYEYVDREDGIPSTGCSPYFATGSGTEHFQQHGTAPPCPTTCTGEDYPRSLQEDLYQPKGVSKYTLIQDPKAQDLETVKRLIQSGGPVAFGIYCTDTFMGYTSGVYTLCGDWSPNHAVHTIGWGVEGGTKYFLGQNSWGTSWGEKGRFKVKECVPTDFTIPGDIELSSTYPTMLQTW